MKLAHLIIRWIVFILLFCCKSSIISQTIIPDDFSEYYHRIANLPKDSMVRTANGGLVPKYLLDLDFLDGCKIPIFQAKSLYGKDLNVNYNGGLTLLNFWFIACTPCVDEIPFLNELQNKYLGKLNIVSICRDPEPYILNFIENHPINYTIVPNAEILIDNHFRMTWGYPKNILVNSDGKVLAMTRGFKGTEDVNYQKIENLIEQNTK
jgi:thiol-disulfide isomerase/thioredoxin